MLGRDIIANCLNFLSGNSMGTDDGIAENDISYKIQQATSALASISNGTGNPLDDSTLNSLHQVLDAYNNGSSEFADAKLTLLGNLNPQRIGSAAAVLANSLSQNF